MQYITAQLELDKIIAEDQELLLVDTQPEIQKSDIDKLLSKYPHLPVKHKANIEKHMMNGEGSVESMHVFCDIENMHIEKNQKLLENISKQLKNLPVDQQKQFQERLDKHGNHYDVNLSKWDYDYLAVAYGKDLEMIDMEIEKAVPTIEDVEKEKDVFTQLEEKGIYVPREMKRRRDNKMILFYEHLLEIKNFKPNIKDQDPESWMKKMFDHSEFHKDFMKLYVDADEGKKTRFERELLELEIILDDVIHPEKKLAVDLEEQEIEEAEEQREVEAELETNQIVEVKLEEQSSESRQQEELEADVEEARLEEEQAQKEESEQVKQTEEEEQAKAQEETEALEADVEEARLKEEQAQKEESEQS